MLSPSPLTFSPLNSFSVVVFGLLLAVNHCNAKPWRSIVPLHSSRGDVHKLLGSPLRSSQYTSSYELPAEIVEFMYVERGPRGTALIDSWKVARDTVINIRLLPTADTIFRGDKPFQRVHDIQQKNIFYYLDPAEGVRYTAKTRADAEYVLSVDYLSAAVDRHLKCSETPDTQTQSIPIFQQYGIISAGLEKAILDNFAIQLQNDQELSGYVVLRRGGYSAKFAAKRLVHIRNYLFKRRRVPPRRISVFEGKPRPDFTIELYLVPKGQPGPT